MLLRTFGFSLIAASLLLSRPAAGAAWPATAYPEIFDDASKTLPGPLRQLLEDMEPLLGETCEETSVLEATVRAIEGFREENGDLIAAVAAMRDAGCAAAEMNDPDMDALVRAQRGRFTVVFYGWHPSITNGDLDGYLQFRETEVAGLSARFERTSELPNRSEMVELSPEFGMASVAYSHAVTDVANVWLYIWISVNGSF